ncbi:MAG TPA: ankyrin repeat domain-containing protein [Pyrinomonadaceae bacterium]|nr:ankyrin repeat domain-containing protein [Pyrinomonadaceae bacterium]
MPNPTTILDHISIPSPCSADWDSMIGNDQVRFCLHCSKHVNNLSEMTRKQALELVARSKGRLCVRYYRRPGGQVQTAGPDSQLYQIKRRASRLATGVFTAAISLCASVAAQTRPVAEQPASSGVEITDRQGGALPASPDLMNGSIAGTLSDPNGAAIPGATVTLVNESSGQEQRMISNGEGQYLFQYLGAGNYTLKVEAAGFDKHETQGVVLTSDAEQRFDVTVGINGGVDVLGGVMAISGEYPLVIAASENDLPRVKELIAAGADVNRRDKNLDATALDEAAIYGNREMVRALLDAGAEINARNSRRQTALMMLDDDATDNLVWDLVSAGAKINLRDEDGDTALILAAGLSNTEALRALLNAGAKINARNKSGETALMKAAGAGNKESVKLLIEFGANLNVRNNDGETALKLAEDNEHQDVVELLDAYSAEK